MPTAGSNFSRYPIPSDLNPEGICCVSVPIPDDPQWFAMLSGALWRLSLQTNWERDDAHSAKIVAARWRAVWTEVQNMAGCCGTVIGDVTINNQINVQNQLYLFQLYQIWAGASFDIQVAFPETPANFDTDPADAGPEIAQRNLALCLAAESFTHTMFNRALSWLSSQSEEVAGLVAASVFIPYVPFYAVLGGLVGLGALAGIVIQQLINGPYREYIACGIYEELKGKSSNSQAAFAAALSNLPARPPPPENVLEDAARDLIETWARSQINNAENYLGFIDGLNTAMAMAAGLSDADCACLSSEGVEVELLESPLYTVDPILTKLTGDRWNVVAGIIDHPTSGLTDHFQILRVGGGCFDATNSVLVSGSMTRTSWQDCGGVPEFGTFGTPLNKPNVDYWSCSDPGETDGLVVNFDALEP